MQYQLTNNPIIVKWIRDDGATWYIPNDPANTEWQEYQKWLAVDLENNVPEPADEE